FMASVRNRYKLYFSGDVFSERVPLERGIDTQEEQPLLFPVGINLVKLLALAQADSLFGEWEEDIVRFKVRQDVQESEAAEQAIKMWATVLNDNNAPSLFNELAIDREIYGGCAVKVAPSLTLPGHLKLSRIDLNSFMPIWDPDDPDVLLEVYAAVKMTKEQCIAKYGFDPGKDEVWRVEHWTPRMYENKIDGKRIDAFSGVNPWGVIPFVYIPRIRTSSFYGDAITPDIIPAQDELNMRIADLGDAINYNSHPIRWAYNLPRAFDSENFPIGPEAMWDMGRVLGNSPPPEVKLLEADNPVPEPAFDYVKFIYDWSRTSAFAPPIAFGEDSGGGQRSGRTLEIRMWPLLRATRRSRGYMAGGLQRIMRIGAVILQQKKFENVSQWTINRTMDGTVVPDFWPLMPKDQAALVDEVVKLLSTSPPSISMETAQTLLGRGPAEVQRIMDMIAKPELKEFLLQNQDEGTPSSSEDA
ncbi:MAG: phage portal protein, partial [Zetaproteobacteria bacterium]|nr:phage portal protein [Zetaproteobacteria bacterium]